MGFFATLLRLLTRASKPAPRAARPRPSLGVTITKVEREYTKAEVQVDMARDRAKRAAEALRKSGVPALPTGASMLTIGLSELRTVALMAGDDFVHASLARDGMRPYRLTLASGQPVLILFSPDHDWIDVLATGKRTDYSAVQPGHYRRFGFTRSGSRWSYGDGPHGAREIRAALRTLDPGIQGRERM